MPYSLLRFEEEHMVQRAELKGAEAGVDGQTFGRPWPTSCPAGTR